MSRYKIPTKCRKLNPLFNRIHFIPHLCISIFSSLKWLADTPSIWIVIRFACFLCARIDSGTWESWEELYKNSPPFTAFIARFINAQPCNSKATGSDPEQSYCNVIILIFLESFLLVLETVKDCSDIKFTPNVEN